MRERQPLTQEQMAERFAADPILADFVVPFPSFFPPGQGGIGASFERMTPLLARAKRAALIQFTIGDRNGVRCWCLTLTPESCRVSEGEDGRPDLEVLISAEEWSKIASGQLSPLAAFGRGKLRVRGDIELARFLARRLHGRQSTEQE